MRRERRENNREAGRRGGERRERIERREEERERERNQRAPSMGPSESAWGQPPVSVASTTHRSVGVAVFLTSPPPRESLSLLSEQVQQHRQ
jgi:hypothetical protein